MANRGQPAQQHQQPAPQAAPLRRSLSAADGHHAIIAARRRMPPCVRICHLLTPLTPFPSHRITSSRADIIVQQLNKNNDTPHIFEQMHHFIRKNKKSFKIKNIKTEIDLFFPAFADFRP
ncbi:MAG: hypothetical protein LPK85_12980 [Gammaproteobacteria bacterium]|nr:hypothetical protein [Gammaproteobacteria bacterium]